MPAPTPEVRVSSWNELNDALYAEAFRPGIGRFGPTVAFRGAGRIEASLSTGLAILV
jgi:hypothetical protein